LRFANWLHNGQPTGAQDAATTEDGAYTITAEGIAGNSITRNAGATVFLTSEDEWYKAAYFDVSTSIYYDYTTGTDVETGCVIPTADTGNSANCNSVISALTDSGVYSASASPNGTYDQGGNVLEWNEAIPTISTLRGIRGGAFGDAASRQAASIRGFLDPVSEERLYGFRVASVPEPSTLFLHGTALLVLVGRAAGRRIETTIRAPASSGYFVSLGSFIGRTSF